MPKGRTTLALLIAGRSWEKIPSDLFMEHLNRTLKDYLKGLGANISDSTILQTGKSLRGLMDMTAYFDELCDIASASLHHTKHSAKELILKEFSESRVFDYIPARCHRSFKNIKAHVSSSIDAFKLVAMIKKHQHAIADYIDLKMILKSIFLLHLSKNIHVVNYIILSTKIKFESVHFSSEIICWQ